MVGDVTGPDFSGARLKLQRAIQLHHLISGEIGEFVDAAPYKFRVTSRAVEDSREEWTLTVVDVKPVPLEWGVLVGDCIHNLRCALDHAVYQVASGTNDQLRWCQFPILRR